VARTGYTGEDGSSFTVTAATLSGYGRRYWMRRAGWVGSVGLGARDTLRLEKAYPLYGHELDDQTTPLEAGLEWVIKFSKAEFFGKDILLRQKEMGLTRKLVGLELLEPGIARSGHALFKNGKSIGRVTSGTKSPSLGKSIALGYVASSEGGIGNVVEVEIRSRKVPARIVSLPFYRR
jgi:aminomethyltransferase